MSGLQEIVDAVGGVHDFRDGAGPVPAHRHVNPDGSVGGWVADGIRFAEKAELWVARDAAVGGTVVIVGTVRVEDRGFATGACHLRSMVLSGDAVVAGTANVGQRHPEMGRVVVTGNATVEGDNTQITGNTRIDGNAYVAGVGTEVRDSIITEDARILGGRVYRSVVGGRATVSGWGNVSGGAVIAGDVIVTDEAKVHGPHMLDGDDVFDGTQELRSEM